MQLISRDFNKTLEKSKKYQIEFKSRLNKRKFKKSDEDKSKLENIETLSNSRNEVVQLFDNFS